MCRENLNLLLLYRPVLSWFTPGGIPGVPLLYHNIKFYPFMCQQGLYLYFVPQGHINIFWQVNSFII